jgi:hypothetical protein
MAEMATRDLRESGESAARRAMRDDPARLGFLVRRANLASAVSRESLARRAIMVIRETRVRRDSSGLPGYLAISVQSARRARRESEVILVQGVSVANVAKAEREEEMAKKERKAKRARPVSAAIRGQRATQVKRVTKGRPVRQGLRGS